MIAKVNVNIVLKTIDKAVVQLWDVDALVDDLLESKDVSASGHVEFIFSTSQSGEANPELQLRILSLERIELFRTTTNNMLSDLKIHEVTGFAEVTTIDFGTIEI
jgi:hypothetical protein